MLYTGMVDLKDIDPGELEITAERSDPDNKDNETMKYPEALTTDHGGAVQQ